MSWFEKKERVTSMPVVCPTCKAIEHMTVRPAERAELVNGQVVQVKCGVCVVCLRCDTPFVIVAHEPGGVIRRRKVAAGIEIPDAPPRPPARPQGDANGIIAGLDRALGESRLMEEPN